MYALQVLQALVQQKGGVVHQHIDKLYELISHPGFTNNGLPVDGVLPHGLEQMANMISVQE